MKKKQRKKEDNNDGGKRSRSHKEGEEVRRKESREGDYIGKNNRRRGG